MHGVGPPSFSHNDNNGKDAAVPRRWAIKESKSIFFFFSLFSSVASNTEPHMSKSYFYYYYYFSLIELMKEDKLIVRRCADTHTQTSREK